MRNLRTPRGRVHRSLTLFIGSTLNSRTDRRTGSLSRTVCLCEREQDSVEIAGLTPFWTPASVVLVFFSVVSPSCALRPDCSKPGLTRGGEDVQWTSETLSAWFVPYVATFLCLLPSFCWQILENWTRKTVETMVLWLLSPWKLCQQFSILKNNDAA